MKEIGLRSYQDIKTPEELEEDFAEECEYNALLREFDPEEAVANGCSYERYKSNCRRIAKSHRYGK